MKHVENFENVDFMILEPEKLYTLPSGLQIELAKAPRSGYWDSPKGIVEPSGIMKSKWVDSTKELVIGDANDFYMFFPKGAKNLEYQYYQVENYTDEDAAHERKKATDVTDWEKGHTLTAFNGRRENPPMTSVHIPMSYSEIQWATFTQHPFIQLAFAVNKFGSLHLDQVEWEDLS